MSALITALAAAGLGGATAWTLAVAVLRRRSRRPWARLRRGIAAVAGAPDGHRLDLDGSDETREVALLVNQLAERLEAREQAFAALADESPDGIVQLDADGTVLYANEAIAALVGVVPGGLAGRLADEAAPAPLAATWRELAQESLMAGTTLARECRVELPAGVRVLDIRCKPERNVSGLTGRALLVHRDVTDARRAEEALHQAQKLESIGQLAGGIAHDFNNLLGALVGHAELALGELPPGHAAAPDLEALRDAALRATGLTRQLLTFARQQPTALTVLDAAESVQRLEGLLRRLLPASVDLVVATGAGAASVRADHAQFEQVLVNLVVNARDAMPAGGRLEIRTSRHDVDAGEASRLGLPSPGPYVAIAVADTGHGMTPDVLARLFEPFFTTKAPGKGTGLGLATCYGIARHHGGALTVRSIVGAGSTFTLWLPAVDAPVPHASPDAAPIGLATAGHETLLVVDDDETMRRLVVRALTANGYATLEARDGAEALRLLLDRSAPAVDLILTDVAMPRLDGLALATQVRRLHPAMPVVFATGDAEAAHALAGTAGEGAILAKPFTTAQLCYAVRAALDAAEASSPAGAPAADDQRRPHWSRWAHNTTTAVAM